jgi:hypothetical protein
MKRRSLMDAAFFSSDNTVLTKTGITLRALEMGRSRRMMRAELFHFSP